MKRSAALCARWLTLNPLASVAQVRVGVSGAAAIITPTSLSHPSRKVTPAVAVKIAVNPSSVLAPRAPASTGNPRLSKSLVAAPAAAALLPLSSLAGTFLPMALARKLGAGKAAPWLGGRGADDCSLLFEEILGRWHGWMI